MSKGDRDRNIKISKTRVSIWLAYDAGSREHFYTHVLALAVAKQYKVQEDKMWNRGQNLVASGPTEQRGFTLLAFRSIYR